MRGTRIRLKPEARKRPRTREELDQLSKERRERYERRKLNQECTACGEKLPAGHDHNLCEPCQGDQALRQERYRSTHKGQRKMHEASKRHYQTRKKRDVCQQCLKPREKWPPFSPEQLARQRVEKPPHCPDCREHMSAHYRRRRQLAAAGVIILDRARKTKAKRAQRAKERRSALKYIPLDETLATTRAKVLRTLARFDWIDVETLFDAIGVPAFDEEDNTERDRYAVLLSRLSREAKHIVRREAPAVARRAGDRYEYQITNAGRAELERMIGRSKAS